MKNLIKKLGVGALIFTNVLFGSIAFAQDYYNLNTTFSADSTARLQNSLAPELLIVNSIDTGAQAISATDLEHTLYPYLQAVLILD